MTGHVQLVIISIGGGHATGVMEAGLQIKESLAKIFPHTEIKVIDLDSRIDEKHRLYTNQDYDLDAVYRQLTENRHSTKAVAIKSADDANSSDPIELVLLCGCYALYDDRINDLAQLKVFLDSDGDKRLINLIKLKKITTGEELSELLAEYMDHLRVEMHKFIGPTRANANLIIPSSNDNTGCAIITDGIVRVVQDIKGNGNHSSSFLSRSPLLLDFEAERMNVEKERYYDLA